MVSPEMKESLTPSLPWIFPGRCLDAYQESLMPRKTEIDWIYARKPSKCLCLSSEVLIALGWLFSMMRGKLSCPCKRDKPLIFSYYLKK